MSLYTPMHVDMMARTMYGECGGEPLKGQIAYAWVVRNRAESSTRWWGNDILSVLLHPRQFSVWNDNDKARKIIIRLKHDNELFQHCLHVATGVLLDRFPDASGGADHYFADYIDPPAWADGSKFTVQIGRHRFYRLRG